MNTKTRNEGRKEPLKYKNIPNRWYFWILFLMIVFFNLWTYNDVDYLNYALDSGEEDLIYCAQNLPGLFSHNISPTILMGSMVGYLLISYILVVFSYFILNRFRKN